jgi:thiamine pyrophosphokinase
MVELHPRYGLIANGAINNYAIIASLLKEYPYIIAVDGGIIHCDKMNITPHQIIGDLDSAPEELLRKYSKVLIQKFPSLKDESDLELAIKSIYHPKIEKITLFGALEKRTDHTLANLHLIRRYPSKVWIETETELIWAFKDDFELPCRPGQVISFISLGEPVTGVSSSGLQWELKDATLDRSFFSLSNVCLKSSVKITVKKGDLIGCLQK